MLDLTDSDLDTLHAVVREHMPRITREIFPAVLAQLVGQGVLWIQVTDAEIAVHMPGLPEVGIHRVARKPRVH